MKCITCQEETKNPRFCSSSCAAKHNNSKHPKRSVEGACKYCKKPIKTTSRFCSKTCKKLHLEKKRLIKMNQSTKKCPLCEKELPNTGKFFAKKGKWLQSYCRKCQIISDIKRQAQKKRDLVKIMGGCCVLCKYNNHFGSLDFHHLDPSEKEFGIGHSKNLSLKKLIEEAKKCILVCKNCHHEIHGGLHPQYLVPPIGLEPITKPS